MTKLMWITDDKKRDAQIAIESATKAERHTMVGPKDAPVQSVRVVKATAGHTLSALMARFGSAEALSKALADGDPEIDVANVGRRVEDAKSGGGNRVWLKQDGAMLYAARALRLVLGPDGEEKERKDFSDTEATVSEETALPYSGRLTDIGEVVHKFVLGRKLRLRHINGLTFDFLFELAAMLEKEKKMLIVGSGSKGVAPLILQTNGSPYRGFLEGRTKDGAYLLLLHLSNLELKPVVT